MTDTNNTDNQIDQTVIDNLTDPKAEIAALKQQLAAKEEEINRRDGDITQMKESMDLVRQQSAALFGGELNDIQMEQTLRSMLHNVGHGAQDIQNYVAYSLYEEEAAEEPAAGQQTPPEQPATQEPQGMDEQTIQQFQALLRGQIQKSTLQMAKDTEIYKQYVELQKSIGNDESVAEAFFSQKAPQGAYAYVSDRANRTGEDVTFDWVDEAAKAGVEYATKELTSVLGGSPTTLGRSASVQDDPVAAVLKKEPVKKPEPGEANFSEKNADWAVDQVIRNAAGGSEL